MGPLKIDTCLMCMTFFQATASSPNLRNRQDCPIVLIAHSIGGLVIKWAFLLSQKDPAFKNLKGRKEQHFENVRVNDFPLRIFHYIEVRA